MPHTELPAVILHHFHFPRRHDAEARSPTVNIRRAKSFHFAGVYVHTKLPMVQLGKLHHLLPVIRHHAKELTAPHAIDDRLDADHRVFELYSKRDPWLILHKAVYFLLQAGYVCFIPFLVSCNVSCTLLLSPLVTPPRAPFPISLSCSSLPDSRLRMWA